MAAVAAIVVPTPAAVCVGMLAGAALASIHALLSIKWRSDQVVSGMALNLVALAGGTFLLETLYAPTGTPSITQLERWQIPLVGDVPVLRALSGHSGAAYLALLAPFLFHIFLWHTPLGLRLRAVGEKPAAAATMGVNVSLLRTCAVLGAGLMAGLGGATLSTSTLDRFEHNMPAGLGFMAMAALVFGRWTPLGAFGAALFFSFGDALRIGLASSAPQVLDVIPQGFLLALPYVLTLLVLSVQRRRGDAPTALGTPYQPELR
jgi:simple sugar transport system permease protein